MLQMRFGNKFLIVIQISKTIQFQNYLFWRPKIENISLLLVSSFFQVPLIDSVHIFAMKIFYSLPESPVCTGCCIKNCFSGVDFNGVSFVGDGIFFVRNIFSWEIFRGNKKVRPFIVYLRFSIVFHWVHCFIIVWHSQCGRKT